MRILVVDDEESMRHMLSVILKKEGYDVTSCADGVSAFKSLEKDDFDFVLCDIKMPKLDGLSFLNKINSASINSTVIMMSAYGTVDTALECMKLGAYDYISKPFKADEIILTIKKASERETLKRENQRLKKEVGKDEAFSRLFAEDPSMLAVLALVKRVADYNTTVLIHGETGTGKELVARAIHQTGSRGSGPFVAVNCGAIPEALLESELFGHVRGAFTDAVKTKNGLFQEADGGTLLLDEIGELPKELQVKLLRVLQEGEVRKVGDTKSSKIDVRVLGATVRDLEEEVKIGTFREDLFYRLNVVTLKIPPLRERPIDIPGLADLFLRRYSAKYSKNLNNFSAEAMEAFRSYGWPGNVRELENVVERAVILEDNGEVGVESLPIGTTGRQTQSAGIDLSTLSIKKASIIMERELIRRALAETGGNKTKASKLLEISHRALLYKIKDYRL